MKKIKFKNNQSLWSLLIQEAKQIDQEDHSANKILQTCLLTHPGIEEALTELLLNHLKPFHDLQVDLKEKMIAFLKIPQHQAVIASDLRVTYERDPACINLLQPFLFYKGFHALVVYRMAHELWKQKEKFLAFYLQSLASQVFTIDIHPAAEIEEKIFIDHGHDIVIGETCRISQGVSILQGVTLGGTGKEVGDRHPKIGEGVLIGAGVKVLGNIQVGRCSKIGASSVVLKDVPPYSVVVGIPAKVVGKINITNEAQPAQTMDHSIE